MCGVTASMKEEERKTLLGACQSLEGKLRDADIRVHGDYRDNYSPGWKFNHWELKVRRGHTLITKHLGGKGSNSAFPLFVLIMMIILKKLISNLKTFC